MAANKRSGKTATREAKGGALAKKYHGGRTSALKTDRDEKPAGATSSAGTTNKSRSAASRTKNAYRRHSSKLSYPSTFMGRRVISIEWKGERVEVVEGRLAYCQNVSGEISHPSAEVALKANVVQSLEPDHLGVGVLQADRGISVKRAITRTLREHPDLNWVEPVFLHYGSFIPDDDSFAMQWALHEIRAARAWDLWNGNLNSVTVAVLDTGIPLEAGRLSHPDLGDRNRFLLGKDWVSRDNDPADDHGHGTHVLGIVAATTNNNLGVAGLWPGPVLAIKVNDSLNRGSDENFKNGVMEAVTLARGNNTRLIINYSSAGPDTETHRAAINFARESGALVVAAAGNHRGTIKFPAAYAARFPNVMAVGAVDRQRRRPVFANRGPEMTVVAPGVGLYSTMPNYSVTLTREGKQPKYDFLDGTSQATALVSGLAALVWSKWPQLTADQVRERISRTADVIPGSPNDFGSGMINAERALSA